MKTARASHKASGPTVIGWREVVGLPELDIDAIKAKIDTGARTSALHATDLEPFEHEGTAWIAFSVPSPVHGEPIPCSAPVADRRAIRNTSGIAEMRIVIRTAIVMGPRRWHVDVSLSDRTEMEFDLILGRSAIRGHNFLVNPGRSYLLEPPAGRARPAAPASDHGLLRTLERGLKTASATSHTGEEE